MSAFSKCEHLREQDYFDPDYDLRFDPHETHECLYYSRRVIPIEDCGPSCPAYVLRQQSKPARPERNLVMPHSPAKASSQRLKAIQYQFDKLITEFQTILESLPPEDRSNPIFPTVQSLEGELSPLEAAQQRRELEIAAASRDLDKTAARIYTLLTAHHKSLQQTVEQHNARLKAFGDSQPNDPEWIAYNQKIWETLGDFLNLTLFLSTISENSGLYIQSPQREPTLPPTHLLEFVNRMLRDDSLLASLWEAFESLSDRVDKLTTERDAINHQIYQIKIERGLNRMRSQLDREIKHREVVQAIYDTFTSRGRAALDRFTDPVSASSAGYFKQFMYEAEKILKLITIPTPTSNVELSRLHRVLGELPLD